MFLSAGVGHRLRGRMATASGVGIRGCTQTNAVTFHFSAGTTPSPPTQTGSLPPSPEAARPLQAPFPLPLATVSPIPVPLRHPVLSLSLFALIPSSPQAPRTSAPPPSPPLAVGAAGGRRHRVFSPSPPARWAWSPPLAMAPRWAWSPPSAAALGWLPSLSSGSRPAWRSTPRRQGWSPRHARRRRRARTWALADATANRPWLFFKTRPLSSGALVARAKTLVFCRLRGGPLWGGGGTGWRLPPPACPQPPRRGSSDWPPTGCGPIWPRERAAVVAPTSVAAAWRAMEAVGRSRSLRASSLGTVAALTTWPEAVAAFANG